MSIAHSTLDIVLDVIVIGAGPAGSATAALLARQGVRVALVDRARFPRPKPCAEYVNPGATRIMRDLLPSGVLDGAGPVQLLGMRIVSAQGTSFTGRFGGAHGLAIERKALDAMLVEAAATSGATVMEGATLEASTLGPDARTVRLRTPRGAKSVRARLVVGADGLRSRVARTLRLARRGALRRVAVVAHATGVTGMDAYGEMHVTPFGYVGMAPLGGGISNLSVVVDLSHGQPLPPLDRWLLERMRSLPGLSGRFADAALVSPPAAVGPFARRSRRATADRAVLVGDAADFHDPFTGEGIYAALRGAALVAAHTRTALERDALTARDLRSYDRARRRAFTGKWILERLVSFAVGRPPAFERVARRLAADPALADRLVGVTGGMLPASDVLRPSYAWQLIR